MVALNNNDSCLNNPDFAIICSFLQKYANILDIVNPSFKELQKIFESTDEVPQDFVDTILKLLRKSRLPTISEYWERGLMRFCSTYSSHDEKEIDRLGFRNVSTSMKLRVIKELFEYQFDHNQFFKWDVNCMSADEQRYQPMMKDGNGNLFWTMFDSNNSEVTVYKEEFDRNGKTVNWNVFAHNRREIEAYLNSLGESITRRRKSERVKYNVRLDDLLDELCEAVGAVERY